MVDGNRARVNSGRRPITADRGPEATQSGEKTKTAKEDENRKGGENQHDAQPQRNAQGGPNLTRKRGSFGRIQEARSDSLDWRASTEAGGGLRLRLGRILGELMRHQAKLITGANGSEDPARHGISAPVAGRLTAKKADEGEGHGSTDDYGEREPPRDAAMPSAQPPHVGREALISGAIRRKPGFRPARTIDDAHRWGFDFGCIAHGFRGRGVA